MPKYYNTEEMMQLILSLDSVASLRMSKVDKKWYISSWIDVVRDGKRVHSSPHENSTFAAVRAYFDILCNVQLPDFLAVQGADGGEFVWNGVAFVPRPIRPPVAPFQVTA